MRNSSHFDSFEKLLENEVDESSAVLQKVTLPNHKNKVRILIKREDLLHPAMSGNKWRKLKYNLIEARKSEMDTLLTFGGAYSNHIYATASAGKLFGFKTIGLIRGEEHLPLNPTINFAKSQGMEIHYIDRKTYRLKNSKEFLNRLLNRFGNVYILPEGGSNNLAVKGCTEIIDDINIDFDYILSACGTGSTLAGLICGLKGEKHIIGIPVLRGAKFLIEDIQSFIKELSNESYVNWELNCNFHFGGYAKINKELIEFIYDFESLNNIKLDPVYTGKLMFALNTLITERKFKDRSTIIALHTGGLQGIAGMKKKIDKLLS